MCHSRPREGVLKYKAPLVKVGISREHRSCSVPSKSEGGRQFRRWKFKASSDLKRTECARENEIPIRERCRCLHLLRRCYSEENALVYRRHDQLVAGGAHVQPIR